MCTIAGAKALERPDNSKPNSSHMSLIGCQSRAKIEDGRLH